MSDATISVWSCLRCNEPNHETATKCSHCGEASNPMPRLWELSIGSELGKEIMKRIGLEVPEKVPRQAKRGEKAAKPSQRKQTNKEKLETDFNTTWERYGTGQKVTRQHAVKSLRYFTPKKRQAKTYNLDFAWPELLFAVEIQGGTYRNGAHSRGKGYSEDRKRIRDLRFMGWTVFEYTTDDLQPNTIYGTILEVNDYMDMLTRSENGSIAA